MNVGILLLGLVRLSAELLAVFVAARNRRPLATAGFTFAALITIAFTATHLTGHVEHHIFDIDGSSVFATPGAILIVAGYLILMEDFKSVRSMLGPIKRKT